MERNKITQIVSALLSLALMTIILPMEVVGQQITGTVHCQYEVHQNAAEHADDLHFRVEMKKDANTKIRWVSVWAAPPCSSTTTSIDGDKRGMTADLYWTNDQIAWCTWVRIVVNLILDGIECDNQQEIADAYWTDDGVKVGDANIRPHEWSVRPRVTVNDTDYHQFELVSHDSVSFYVRNLEFHYGNTGIVGDSLFNFTGWMTELYTGGDFLLLPDSSMSHDIAIPAQGGNLIHTHGHYEIWSGSEKADSLLVECWFHHYDFEALAAQMGEILATADNYGNIVVSWSTYSEVDMVGFNIHRSTSEDGGYTQINEELISAMGSPIEGSSYSFTDEDVTSGVTYYFWLEAVDLYGNSTMHGPVAATPTSVEEKEEAPIPTVFSLAQNYPNPFNATTAISYQLSGVSPHRTTLKVYNIAGQVVRTLVDEEQAPGYYSVSWDGRDGLGKEVSSGVYFYRLQAGSYTEMKKMILLK